MKRTFRAVLFWTLILSACSAVPAAPETVPAVTTAAPLPLPTTSIPDTKPISTVGTPHIERPPDGESMTALPTTTGPDATLISTLSTPHIDQPPAPNQEITAAPPGPGDCGYQWASQALPELSSSFQQSIQTLQTEATANAYAFGENCILSDGSFGGFLAKETDFNVTLQVAGCRSHR